MIYAESDFLLALIKSSDWLKSNAEKIYNENKGNIATSTATVIEVALVCERLGLNVEDAIGSIFKMSDVEGMTREEGMEAANLIQDENLNVFDAFHAALSRGRPIASSEHVYDKIGKQRIKLEE